MRTQPPTSSDWKPGRAFSALFVVAAATLPGAPRAAQGQDAVRLEIGGATGDWLEYTHRKEIRVELPPDLGGTATTVTTIRLRQDIDSVSAEAIHFASRLEELTFEASPEPPGLPDLAGLQGLQFEHSTSLSGRTVALSLPGEYGAAGPGFLEQVENWLSQLGFPPLPVDPVRVGDSWSNSMPIPAAALGLALEYDLVQERTTRLVRMQDVGVSLVAVLEVKTKWTPDPASAEPSRGVASLKGTAEQTVRFDIRRGRFLGSTGTSELELVLTPAGSAQYVVVSATGQQVTGLTASGGPP